MYMYFYVSNVIKSSEELLAVGSSQTTLLWAELVGQRLALIGYTYSMRQC